jgi:hypothetical protein
MQFIVSGNYSTYFGWYYHPKHVEKFPDKINCITLHLVGYILEYGIITTHRPMNVKDICSYLFMCERYGLTGIIHFVVC